MALKDFKSDKRHSGNPGRGGYSDEHLINCLLEYYTQHSHISKKEFDTNSDYPSAGCIVRHFNSWNSGLKKAGIPINKSAVSITSDMESESYEKAYIIGVLLGDGCLTKSSKGDVSIQLVAKDKEFIEEFGELFCQWADLEWHGWGSEYTELCCYGPLFENHSDKAKCYGVSKGFNAGYEHINNILSYDCNDMIETFDNYRIELVRGLWDSEGSISSNRVRFASSEPRIINMYIKLLGDMLDISVSGCSWASESKYGIKLGDFYIFENSGFENSGVYNVALPADKTDRFVNMVQPTISRKYDS